MKLRDERGMVAIGGALMLLVVLPLLATALWQYSALELKNVQRGREDMQALFLARAGAEAVRQAWQQTADPKQRPFGQLDTLYFDLTTNAFTTNKPSRYLGTVDVEVREEAATADEVEKVTVVESTANVGSATRIVRLVTYPHRYGHQDPLLWYDPNEGRIPGTPIYTARKEPVIMRSSDGNTPISLGSRMIGHLWEGPPSVTFKASDIIFESPLQVVRRGDLYGADHGFDLVLEAEKIFFSGLEIARLNTIWDTWEYTVTLKLPTFDEKLGLLGNTLLERNLVNVNDRGKIERSARYGQVYFDFNGRSVKVVPYTRFIFLATGNPSSITPPDEGESPVKGYYFREEFRFDPNDILALRNGFDQYINEKVNEGVLIPIPVEHMVTRAHLERQRPFYWAQ